MMMSWKRNIAIVVALFIFGILIGIQAKDSCGKCMERGIVCVTKKIYKMCNNESVASEENKCGPNEVCTNSTDICEPEDNLPTDAIAVCSTETDACSKCVNGIVNPCVTITDYGYCAKNKLLNGSMSCGKDQICVNEAAKTFGSPCIPTSIAKYLGWEPTCTNDETTTKAPITSPTISPNDLEERCVDECVGEPALTYCTLEYDADLDCDKSYIYCEKVQDDEFSYAVLHCPGETYYNKTNATSGECKKIATCP